VTFYISALEILLLTYLLQMSNYSDYCVLTDVDLRVSVDSGWHPSHLDMFDPRTKHSRIVLFRHNRDCSLRTNLTLTANKQVRPVSSTYICLRYSAKLPT